MSTIKVNKIENTSTTDGGVEIDSSGHVQVDGLQMPTAGALSNRNLVINGGMTVSQRSTQVTGVTSDGYRTVDRFKIQLNSLGTWTVDQSTDSPDGFANSLKATCTTASASPGASSYSYFMHRIEAQNLQHLNFGSAAAQDSIVSFWVKSNKTGNASFNVIQPDASFKVIPFQYSISAADTWEFKSFVIPGDASGTINNDNGHGMQLEWWFNSGSNWTGSSHGTTWTANTSTNRNVSNLGVGGAVNDYFQITGVQLEVGEKATPFEHRSYGDELARCQRYLFRVNGNSADQTAIGIGHNTTTASCRAIVHLPVSMRSVGQTVSENGLNSLYDNTNEIGLSIISLDEGINAVAIFCSPTSGSPFTVGRANYIRLDDSTTAFFQVESEL